MTSTANHYGPVVTRAVVPLLGLILATLICPAPVLAGPFTAVGLVWQEFYPPGPPGVSTNSPTGATFMQLFTAGDISLLSNAAASAGNLSLHTFASINAMTNWDSGHVRSQAEGGMSEPVAAEWQLWNNVPFTSLTLGYEIWVSGNPSAFSGGYGAAGGGAGLTYSYAVGDSSGGGNWSVTSDGRVSKNGTWNGVIRSSFSVSRDNTFTLGLGASAIADGSKTYAPGSNTTVVSNADFSHTMIWLGITGVRAFDSLGNEVPLPPDFYLPLIGQDSGFDYWYSAAAPASVPEPATGLLLGSGLVAAGLIRKSVVRRRDS